MHIQKGVYRAVSLLLTMLLVFGFFVAPVAYAEGPATPETAGTELVPTATPEPTAVAAEPTTAPTATPEPTAVAAEPTAAPTATPEPTAVVAEPTAAPTATPAVSTPTLPGPPVMQTSETGLTDEEIAALTQGMLTPMDDEGIMTLADPDHDDDDILTAIKAQLAAADDQKYSDAFGYATGIKYDNTTGNITEGTLKWATPTGCSVWDGTVPAANAYTVPTDGSVFQIDTAEKLAWVMNQFSKGIKFKAELTTDIDLNGQNHYWNPGSMGVGDQVLDGQNHTIYNLCVNMNSTAGFVSRADKSSYIENLTFDTGYILNNGSNGYAALIGDIYSGDADAEYSNLHAKNLVVCSKSATTGITNGNTGTLVGRIQQKSEKRTTLSNCTAQDCTVLGKDHVGSLTGCVLTTDAKYCYSTGCTVISYGAHSGGLFSCSSASKFDNCFTDVRLYGSQVTGIFIGGVNSGEAGGVTKFTNCAASGFVDGDTLIGGFVGGIEGSTDATFTNCYTTALVGINSVGGQNLGGFVGAIGVKASYPSYPVNQGIKQVTFENCYAGGEVGNVHTDMKLPDDIDNLGNSAYTNGGFVGTAFRSTPVNPVTFTKSYYDKQTTAMREQGVGYFPTRIASTATPPQTYPIGVLTTDSVKSGTGLTGGCDGADGFTGFTSNSEWSFDLADHYTPGSGQKMSDKALHYPELKAFSAALVDSTGVGGWVNLDMANTAKAFSLSSTSTVLLDTWDYALNTEMGEMYKATDDAADKPLPTTTYCTVRDLTSAFPLTSDVITDSANGAKVQENNTWIPVANSYGETKNRATTTVQINGNNEKHFVLTVQHNQDGTYLCDEFLPGMEWLLVSNTVGGQTVNRHVRVTPTASIEAGVSKMVTTDEAYDHREDVELFFSTAEHVEEAPPANIKYGKYPDMELGPDEDNERYINVTVNPAVMSFDNTDNAKTGQLYVYLKEIEGFDAYTGAIDTVSLAGGATESSVWGEPVPNAIDEDLIYANAFNGTSALPNVDKRYLLTYMWKLDDGRVVQDAKIIRSAKVPFTVELNVFHNMSDETLENFIAYKKANSYTDALNAHYNSYLYNSGVKTDAQKGDTAGAFTPTFGLQDSAHAILTTNGDLETGVPLHKPSAVAWELKYPTDDYIRSVTLTMDVLQAAVDTTKESYSRTFTMDRDGNPLGDGSKLDLEYTLYRLVYKNNTYYTVPERVTRTYTLKKDSTTGTYSIVFDKHADVELTDGGTVTPDNMDTPTGGDPVYFNDMEFNLRADVVVGHKYNLFSLTKKVTGNLSDPDKVFDFTGVCEVKNVDEAGNVTYTKLAKNTVLNYTLTGEDDPQPVTVGDDGKIEFKLKHGQTATFVNVPFDQITVTENIETTDGYTTSYTTAYGTVDAESNRTQTGTGGEPVTNTATAALDITRAGYVYNAATKEYVETAGKYVDLTFTNNRVNAPPTGIREDAMPFVVFGSFTFAGLALLLALAYADDRRRKAH